MPEWVDPRDRGPGGTLERLDPYDRQFATTLTLIVGKGGGGKTVTDPARRGSSPKAGGSTSPTAAPPPMTAATPAAPATTTRSLSLIPGARRVQLGTAHGAVICPWDVPDLDHVPDQKIEFLLALHALLIGEAHDAEGLVRTLDADEEALLRDAITTSTSDAPTAGERPREQLLIDALSAASKRASSAARTPTSSSRCCCASARTPAGRSRTSPTGDHRRRGCAAGAVRFHRPV